jgi:predicted nucleic acid-binding protein
MVIDSSALVAILLRESKRQSITSMQRIEATEFELGQMPRQQLLSDMGKFNQELMAAAEACARPRRVRE